MNTNMTRSRARLRSTLAIAAIATAALLSPVTSQAPAAAATPNSTFVSVPYQRLVDIPVTGPTFKPGETRNFTVTGVAGVPSSGVEAVVLDITATKTDTANAATLQVWSAGTTRPNTGVVRFTQTTAPLSNTVIVAPSALGQVSVYNSDGNTNLNIDVQGYFTAGDFGGFNALRTPIADTPTSLGFSGPLGDGTVKSLQVTGTAGIPSTAKAVFANVAALSPSSDGSVTFYNRDSSPGTAKSFNFSNGATDTTGLVIPLDSTGGFSLKTALSQTAASLGLRIDIQGYFDNTPVDGGEFQVSPQTVVFDSNGTGGAAVAGGQAISILVGGVVENIPTYGVEGVVVTTTAKSFSTSGGLKAFAQGGLEPANPFLQFSGSEGGSSGVSTTTVVPLGLDGKIQLRNTSSQPVDLKVFVEGWFAGYRAISESDEANFINAVTNNGVPANVANLAVWNIEMVETMPYSIETVTTDDVDLDPAPMTNDDSVVSGPVPIPPADAQVNTSPVSGAADGQTFARGVGNGNCRDGYKHWSGKEHKLAKSFFGVPLYTIDLRKKWCASESLGLIDSVWVKQSGDVKLGVQSFITDEGTNGDKSKDEYLKADGVHDRSGHYSKRVRVFRYCSLFGVGVCYNTDWKQHFNAFWNGTRISWTTWSS